MGDTTTISWTEATWSPFRGTGGMAKNAQGPIIGEPGPAPGRWVCKTISPGCDYCYASTLNARFGGRQYGPEGSPLVDAVRLDTHILEQPLRAWKERRRVIFFSSMTDVFGSWVPESWLDQAFAVMALSPQHTYQVLTKRPSEMLKYLIYPGTHWRIQEAARALLLRLGKPPVILSWPGWPLPNVWLGVSVESAAYVWRMKVLQQCPAVLRFVSAEPLLGRLGDDFRDVVKSYPCPTCVGMGRRRIGDPWGSCFDCRNSPAGFGYLPGDIHWVIIGGESAGPAERALVRRHCPRGCVNSSGVPYQGDTCNGTGWVPRFEGLSAVRNIVDACTENGVAVWLKQWGGPKPDSAGHLLDGRTIQTWPFGWEGGFRAR